MSRMFRKKFPENPFLGFNLLELLFLFKALFGFIIRMRNLLNARRWTIFIKMVNYVVIFITLNYDNTQTGLSK
jgi:hypothetical protein